MRILALFAMLIHTPISPADDEAELFRLKSAATAFASRGESIALAFSGDARVVDPRTGRDLASLPKSAAKASSLSFSADGKLLALGSSRGAAVLIDAASGTEIASFEVSQHGAAAVALSPDGKRLAAGGHIFTGPPPNGMQPSPRFHVWDIATKKVLLRGPWPTEGGELAFSPDGKSLATSIAGGINLWDLESAKRSRLMTGHEQAPTALAWSPDGKVLASGCRQGMIRLWNSADGRPRAFTRKASGAIRGLAFTADAKRLIAIEVTAEETAARSYDPADDRTACLFCPTAKEAFALAASADRLFAADDDGVLCWELATGRALPPLKEHSYGLGGVAFSRDASRVATLDRNAALRVWDTTAGKLLVTQKKVGKFAVAFSPDARLIAVEDGNAAVVLDAEGNERYAIAGHRKTLVALEFTGDNKALVTGGQDRLVKWWDARNGKALGQAEHLEAITALATSQDGKLVAAAGEEGTIFLYDAATRGEIAKLSGHSRAPRSIAFSPDGTTLASGTTDGKLILWDVATRKERVRLTTNLACGVVAFTPDGRTLLTAGESRVVHFWDPATGREKARP